MNEKPIMEKRNAIANLILLVLYSVKTLVIMLVTNNNINQIVLVQNVEFMCAPLPESIFRRLRYFMTINDKSNKCITKTAKIIDGSQTQSGFL